MAPVTAVMTACVTDTSWLVALLNPDDDHSATALAEARALQRAHIPPVILAETLGFMKHRTGRKDIMREVVTRLSAQPLFILASPEHDHDATMRYWDENPKLSYHDAAAVAAARRLGLPLATFDKDQKAAMG